MAEVSPAGQINLAGAWLHPEARMTPGERQAADYKLHAMHDGPAYTPHSMQLWELSGMQAAVQMKLIGAKQRLSELQKRQRRS